METKKFTTSQFVVWPFLNGKWIGFMPTFTIEVSNEGVTFIVNEKNMIKFTSEEVESAQFNDTWFGLGGTKLCFSRKSNNYEDTRGDHWCMFKNDYCYIDSSNEAEAIQAFKAIGIKCFNEKSVSLKNNSLWMSCDYITEYNGKYESYSEALSIPDIKYYYSKKGKIPLNVTNPTLKKIIPFINPVLITGAEHPLQFKGLDSNDIAKLKQHVIDNGAMLGDVNVAEFNHAFSFDAIFNPSLWFTSSVIGLGEKGVSFSQKTFKTDDNIFMPYDKINFATSAGKWYNLTRKIYIYGEQNIVPKRKFSPSDAKRIINELREKGIGQIEGEGYSESYHSSWIGVLFSFITLGIWHGITVIFSKKRNSIIIGDDMFLWNGNILLIDPENYLREKEKKLNVLVGKVEDVKDVQFYKKRWYHLWGYLYIWVAPLNIRSNAFEAKQISADYGLEMNKVYSSTAKRIKKSFEREGYKEDTSLHKLLKKWIKKTI